MNNVKEDRSIVFFIVLKVLWVVLNFFGIPLLEAIIKYCTLAYDLDFMGSTFVMFLINVTYFIIYNVLIFCFYSRWSEDVNLTCNGDGQNTSGALAYFLLSFITFGIYSYFWKYNLQNRLKSNAYKYNVVVTDSGSTVLLWDILGALLFGIGPLIAMHIMLESTNKLAYAYNHNSGIMSPAIPSLNTPPAASAPPVPVSAPPASPSIPAVPASLSAPAALASPSTPPVTPPPAPVAPSVTPPQYPVMGQVKCIRGAAVGQGFKLPANAKVVVGKNPNKATLVVNESYVSNVHCTIQYNAENNTYIVTDHSTNGTFVNGKRLNKESPMTCPSGTVLDLVNENIKIKLG